MPLGRFLVERNVVDPGQVEAARRHQKASGGSLIESLVALGLVSSEEIASLLDAAPTAPDEVAETGLDTQFLVNFLLKVFYVHGFETAAQIADFVKLPVPIVEDLLEELKQKRHVEVLGLTRDRSPAFRFAITDAGRSWALAALDQCQYTGPIPVTLAAYQEQVAKQTVTREHITPAALERAVSHLVLPPGIMSRLGPALAASRALLLYGPPGNGKTSIAESLGDVYEQEIWIPYCIAVNGQIIKIFDAAVHEPVAGAGEPEQPSTAELIQRTLAGVDALDGAGRLATAADGSEDFALHRAVVDPRWVRCRRPVVLTAGELNMEMLDLRFDPVAKYYEAPAHAKATGGVFIIDDFGRQRVSSRDLVNRWIMPLERRIDYLTLHTGMKLEMPFDQLVVFSTNFPPGELMDGAGLRRIPYKFHLGAPDADSYREILRRVARARGLTVPEEVFAFLLDDFYPRTGIVLSCAHPGFIVDHCFERCRFEGRPPRLDAEVVREATLNLELVQD
jgi:hypothetical protein